MIKEVKQQFSHKISVNEQRNNKNFLTQEDNNGPVIVKNTFSPISNKFDFEKNIQDIMAEDLNLGNLIIETNPNTNINFNNVTNTNNINSNRINSNRNSLNKNNPSTPKNKTSNTTTNINTIPNSSNSNGPNFSPMSKVSTKSKVSNTKTTATAISISNPRGHQRVQSLIVPNYGQIPSNSKTNPTNQSNPTNPNEQALNLIKEAMIYKDDIKANNSIFKTDHDITTKESPAKHKKTHSTSIPTHASANNELNSSKNSINYNYCPTHVNVIKNSPAPRTNKNSEYTNITVYARFRPLNLSELVIYFYYYITYLYIE